MPTHFQFRRGTPRSTQGFSLIEIMVAAVIGLIGIIVISQVFVASEGLKRTTTGGADALVNGNIALFTLERDVRYAGFGMLTNNSNMLGCNTLAYDSTRLSSTNFSFTMAPVIITVGAAGAPDSINVVYGSASNIIEGNAFSRAAAVGADFPLKNAAGLKVASLVLACRGPRLPAGGN
jgi:type IV pilus assembly protein PilW